MSEIQPFYEGKSIFLTGGTGFLGKLIIRKLLNTTDVKSIYLILRPKRGVSVEERTNQLLAHEIFSDVRHNIGKIIAFSGDLNKLMLGLSDSDRETLQKNIDVIIHCGACLNMMPNIKESILSNVRSTRDILELAKKCKKLVAFLYVSTAYSNAPKSVIEETFFEAPINSEVLIKMAEELDCNTLERISAEIRGPWPNYYVFTKAVSESLIKDAAGSIPVGLFRPSIITSTMEEPTRGWTDNLYGPLGLLLNINLGILRVLPVDPSVRFDMIPADMVVNAILCTTWEIDQRWQKTKETCDYVPPVINFSGKDSSIYVDSKRLIDSTKIALKSAIWYPTCFLTNYRLFYIILNVFLHIIPHYVMDQLAILLKQKPIASRLFKKISKVCESLNTFMKNEWTIKNDNIITLWKKLSDVDRVMFNFDVTTINREEYFQSVASGLKQYIVKEDLKDMAQHKKRLSWLKMIHFLTIGLMLALIFPIIKIIFTFLLFLAQNFV